jgi:uncharacterized repeat protein (TIGR01451 family)
MKRSRLLIALLFGNILWLALTLAPGAAPPAQAGDWRAAGLLSAQTSGRPETVEAEDLQGKIEPALWRQILVGEPESSYRVIVELVRQAELAEARQGLSRLDRRSQVVSELQATARSAQRGLLTYLEAEQAAGQVERIQPFWVFNGVGLTAQGDTLLEVAQRPEVRFIREDRWRRWVEPFSAVEGALTQVDSNVEWNIGRIRADEAWSALGLDGEGVTVAIMDTGVDWQHPALQPQYRGYKPGGLVNHYGNWFCTTEEGYLYPVDGSGHGTHVAGTAVGGRDGAGTAIGVAPGARWIAVKMLSDAGFGYDSWIHAAFEWLLAPASDPALAPDVVNGSWGASGAADPAFRPDVQALRAAGIVPVFAAGNEGPQSASLRRPAGYPEALAVGATDDKDQVAYFSSRGPSPWSETKPEVVAPGTQIRSSLPGGTYGTHSGTSMAAPHVSGLAAILLQADPSLTVDEIEGLLTTTAVALGDRIPNDDTGWGRIDSYKAGALAAGAGFVAGQIRRQPDLAPLPGAQVTAFDSEGQAQVQVDTDPSGRYRLALLPGSFDLTAEAFGYGLVTMPGVMVQAGLTVTLDLTLSPLPAGVVWGQVTNVETGGPVGARLLVPSTPVQTESDPYTGQYSLALPAGTYTLQAAQNGYQRQTLPEFELAAGGALRLDMALLPRPTLLLVDSGPWYYGSQVSFFEQALEDNDWVYDTQPIRDLGTDLPTLTPYELVVWSSPLDGPGMIGAGDVISDYLSMGGSLFLSGQDVGFWDDGLSGVTWHEYYGRFLKATAVEDNAGREPVEGIAGDILDGLSLPFNGPDSAGNQVSPDLVALLDPRDGAVVARYGDLDAAALRAGACQSYRSVYLAAGLEGLGDRADRAAAMDRILGWLAVPPPAVDADLYPPHNEQVWLSGSVLTYTVELRNLGASNDRFALELSPSSWSASIWDGSFSEPLTQSVALGSCETQTLGVRVTVPAEVSWNVVDTVTLTARSLGDPARTAQATFVSKAPAPILLVDDGRWYDSASHYTAALGTRQLPYDLWQTNYPSWPSPGTPSSQQLARYPLLVWFTGRDWHSPLSPADEALLAGYLDGGGRLLLSSQEYLAGSGSDGFATDYLGVINYVESLSVTQVIGALQSPVAQGIDSIELYYPFPNWSDALRFSAAARPAFWGQHGQPVALTLQQGPWKTAFFAFPLETMPAADLASLLGQAVGWLSPLGDSALAAKPTTARAGDQVTYTLEIRNTGPRPLESVYLSNTIPVSATYVAGSLEGPASYDPATRRFVWSGPLATGQMVTVRYRLQMDASLPAGSTIRSVMHLHDESGLALERIALNLIEAPDLSGSAKTVSAGTATAGEVLTYTITLTNDGLATASAELIDPWPLYTLPVTGSAWASNGQITTTEQTLQWRGAIPPGQQVKLHFTVVPLSNCMGLYAYNRAIVNDGWGYHYPMEAFTRVEARLFLPLIFW